MSALSSQLLFGLAVVNRRYNYKVVDNSIVFRVLYMVINRGHALRPGTQSHRNALRLCVVDPATDMGLVPPQGALSLHGDPFSTHMHPTHAPWTVTLSQPTCTKMPTSLHPRMHVHVRAHARAAAGRERAVLCTITCPTASCVFV